MTPPPGVAQRKRTGSGAWRSRAAGPSRRRGSGGGRGSAQFVPLGMDEESGAVEVFHLHVDDDDSEF